VSEEVPERWRLRGLELALDAPEGSEREVVCEHLGLSEQDLRAVRLVRKSIDLRGRARGRAPRWNLQVDVVLAPRARSKRLARLKKSGELREAPPQESLLVAEAAAGFRGGRPPRVVVIGAGPGGTFAALTLALNGAEVLVLDRGSAIERRSKELVRFHRTRVPDPESNLLFGEGGAGTYSDGKLYTRVDDSLEVEVLRELVAAGAREDILWDARAHIGTDRLHKVLPALRRRLEELGVVFHWNTRMEGLCLAPGPQQRVRAVRTSAGEVPCDALLFAPGHSAEDTWRGLHAEGVPFLSKPFQLGVRVEHPQELIDRGRHGEWAAALGAASYNLVCKASSDLSGAHSFCMCPGGKIVASVNVAGMLCTNGMSNSTHSSPWANSALVTTYTSEHFGAGPFAGLDFRSELERRFFVAGGSDYSAPAQRVPDFLAGRVSASVGPTSYTFGAVPGPVHQLLPEPGRSALARALERFERQLPGFAGPEGLLVGIETRSSGPVRIPRDRETRLAEGFTNLWPVGEGAGYAGGIMSAALDGVRSAQALIRIGARAG
jgi:uncharacterized FAD-dependent dehydrogenase